MKALISILATAACASVLPTTPAEAHHPTSTANVEVTTGSFDTLPGGAALGYDVRGHAIMIRSDRQGGRTSVAVFARGLDASTTYPVHVHNQPCSFAPPGGGHYQHLVGGAVDPANEIWPAITTGRLGVGFGHASHDHRARADARSIVVHYPPDTSTRLACLDLG